MNGPSSLPFRPSWNIQLQQETSFTMQLTFPFTGPAGSLPLDDEPLHSPH
ncbi:MAG: hypothetical protein PWR07_1930 [Bacillota bacterium]|nr:hypothetical protein [Bacillota bacterium]